MSELRVPRKRRRSLAARVQLSSKAGDSREAVVLVDPHVSITKNQTPLDENNRLATVRGWAWGGGDADAVREEAQTKRVVSVVTLSRKMSGFAFENYF